MIKPKFHIKHPENSGITSYTLCNSSVNTRRVVTYDEFKLSDSRCAKCQRAWEKKTDEEKTK